MTNPDQQKSKQISQAEQQAIRERLSKAMLLTPGDYFTCLEMGIAFADGAVVETLYGFKSPQDLLSIKTVK